ncbi:4,5-DOPA dioxygenase extradiol [Pseudorhodoferax sp.]|uniref:4,5-DOPA-extradiol-dioxygenase n=1 Tax=Pseudorhodoferax sp. TaxID=1993553 RepID=UPI002DD6B7F4|nr:4,5-DOPA dioxygenase extradiol [Pseudorhodoferax sp.]
MPVSRLSATFHTQRRGLLRHAGALAALGALDALDALVSPAHAQAARNQPAARRMPVLFIGHGSPMNALRDTAFTRQLSSWGRALPRPTAILSVSAHWLTRGDTRVGVQARPRTIHDFGGFPQALFDQQYPAPGHPALAREAAALVRQAQVAGTEEWGLDHGTWTVLKHLVPEADVPVFQLSIDYDQPAAFHLAVGRDLAALRDKGVLVLGSGNIAHNLRMTDRDSADGLMASRPWAQQFDAAAWQALAGRDDAALLDYRRLPGAAQAVATPDHYHPLLYSVGAAGPGEAVKTVFEGFQSGTISMRCLQFG